MKGRSSTDVVMKGGRSLPFFSGSSFSFESGKETKSRMEKAYVGEVIIPGSAYNNQTHFEMEGLFYIKFTPLGACLCLLDEMEEGFIAELTNKGSTWRKQWFKSIKPWKIFDLDMERVMWIRIFGVPCHAWCGEFFVAWANSFGSLYVWMRTRQTNLPWI